MPSMGAWCHSRQSDVSPPPRRREGQKGREGRGMGEERDRALQQPHPDMHNHTTTRNLDLQCNATAEAHYLNDKSAWHDRIGLRQPNFAPVKIASVPSTRSRMQLCDTRDGPKDVHREPHRGRKLPTRPKGQVPDGLAVLARDTTDRMLQPRKSHSRQICVSCSVVFRNPPSPGPASREATPTAVSARNAKQRHRVCRNHCIWTHSAIALKNCAQSAIARTHGDVAEALPPTAPASPIYVLVQGQRRAMARSKVVIFAAWWHLAEVVQLAG